MHMLMAALADKEADRRHGLINTALDDIRDMIVEATRDALAAGVNGVQITVHAVDSRTADLTDRDIARETP